MPWRCSYQKKTSIKTALESNMTFTTKQAWMIKRVTPALPSSLQINVVICWFGDPAKRHEKLEQSCARLSKGFEPPEKQPGFSLHCLVEVASQLPTKRMNHLTCNIYIHPNGFIENRERRLGACCYGSIKGHCILVHSLKHCQGLSLRDSNTMAYDACDPDQVVCLPPRKWTNLPYEKDQFKGQI